MSESEKTEPLNPVLQAQVLKLATEFQEFKFNAAGGAARYSKALLWFAANCGFTPGGDCFYTGDQKDPDLFIPISLELADPSAAYTVLILYERELFLKKHKTH